MTQEVRVRIAPSPTGAPHLGTAYIALFNQVFAKSKQGKFILRIEDTDQTRSHPLYEKYILDALKWVGLTWDEGPDVGGDYGPYRQSERTDIYKKHAEMLLEKGAAYRCFCTPERLNEMRAECRKQKKNPMYDGKCKALTEKDIAENLAQKLPFVVRLNVPAEGECVVSDRLRGEVRYNFKEVDDQVLIKSDGFPTYHLANVVDDYLMKVTHVIRGEEWLPSTPKHILLYDLLGWEKPEFIHMPLLLNPDGSKLSKRKNPTSIFYYRDGGFLAEALLNYLGRMGYSRPNGEEQFTLSEMTEDFNIDRISLGGSVFDIKKLKWLSGTYIQKKISQDEFYANLHKWRLNEDFIKKIIPLVQIRMETLGDFIPLCAFFWANELDYPKEDLLPKKKEESEVVKVLHTFLMEIDKSATWTAEFIEQKIKELANLWEWKIREVTGTFFVAITGRKVAPPLFESMEILGKDLTRVRVVAAIEKLGGISKKKLKSLEKELAQRQKNLETSEM